MNHDDDDDKYSRELGEHVLPDDAAHVHLLHAQTGGIRELPEQVGALDQHVPDPQAGPFGVAAGLDGRHEHVQGRLCISRRCGCGCVVVVVVVVRGQGLLDDAPQRSVRPYRQLDKVGSLKGIRSCGAARGIHQRRVARRRDGGGRTEAFVGGDESHCQPSRVAARTASSALPASSPRDSSRTVAGCNIRRCPSLRDERRRRGERRGLGTCRRIAPGAGACCSSRKGGLKRLAGGIAGGNRQQEYGQ
jgi:hypothetical protein